MPETKVEVKDPFADASLVDSREAITTLSSEAKAIFDGHKDDKGATDYGAITDDENDKLREINVKMAQARTRFEKLNKLAGFDDEATKLSDYMKAPVTLAPALPVPPKDPAMSLGVATFKALQKDPYKDGTDWGHAFDDAKRWAAEGSVKALLGTDSGLADVGAQYVPENIRIGTIVETLYQAHNIAPLIPAVTTDMNAVPYMVETVTTENALEVAEGALGAESVIDWAETVEPIRKLTVLQPATEELLADVGAIRSIIDGRLRQFVGNREDLQLIHGDGIAPNLEGILARTGVQNFDYSLTAETAQGLAEAALSASNLVRTVFQTPTAYVMNVGTWETIRLAKDTQLNYLFAGPADAAQPRLWGLPVILNQNMDDALLATEVPILTGDFSGAATIFRRQGVTVQVSDSHDDTFARGVLTIRLTERLGLVVWRPAGFATVTRIA